MINRMIGAALLKVNTFEEVEADASATLQAMLVVVIVALATGIGTLLTGGFGGLVTGVLVGLAGWAIWAWITYLVGTTIFKTPATHANWGELARVLGFAQTPGVFRALAIIPGIAPVVLIIVAIWQLAAMVVAVRQALDYTSTARAIGVVVVGFIPYAVLTLLMLARAGGQPSSGS